MGDVRIGAYRAPWWVRSGSRPHFFQKRHVPYFASTGSVDIPRVGVSLILCVRHTLRDECTQRDVEDVGCYAQIHNNNKNSI